MIKVETQILYFILIKEEKILIPIARNVKRTIIEKYQ